MNLSFLGCCFFFFRGYVGCRECTLFFLCVSTLKWKTPWQQLGFPMFSAWGNSSRRTPGGPKLFLSSPTISKQKLFFLETQRLQVAKGNLTLIDSKIWSLQYSKSWFICQAWARVKGTCWKPMFRLPSMEQIYSLPRHFWRWFSQAGVS